MLTGDGDCAGLKAGFILTVCCLCVIWPFRRPIKEIELTSSLPEDAGFASFPASETAFEPSEGQLRLPTGSNAMHIEASAQNHLYLNDRFVTGFRLAVRDHHARVPAVTKIGFNIKSANGSEALRGR